MGTAFEDQWDDTIELDFRGFMTDMLGQLVRQYPKLAPKATFFNAIKIYVRDRGGVSEPKEFLKTYPWAREVFDKVKRHVPDGARVMPKARAGWGNCGPCCIWAGCSSRRG
jgi:hypothetical protein